MTKNSALCTAFMVIKNPPTLVFLSVGGLAVL